MTKTLITTDNFLMGFDTEKDESVLGGLELYNNPNIERIEFDECSWRDEKSYFFDGYLNEVIQRYENRYNTTVTDIALIGSVGVWTGNHAGGRIFDVGTNPIDMMGEVDVIEVIANDDGEITIQGIHHDGRHIMNIYLLTESKLKKYAPDYLNFGEYGVEDMKRIQENTSFVKYCKLAEGYFGKLMEEAV